MTMNYVDIAAKHTTISGKAVICSCRFFASLVLLFVFIWVISWNNSNKSGNSFNWLWQCQSCSPWGQSFMALAL